MSPNEVAKVVVDNGGITVRRVSHDYLLACNDAGIYVGLDQQSSPILDTGDVTTQVASWAADCGPSPFMGFWLQHSPKTVLHCDRVAIIPNRRPVDVAYAVALGVLHGQQELFVRQPGGIGKDVALRDASGFTGDTMRSAWFEVVTYGHWHIIKVHASSILPFGHRKSDRTSWVFAGFQEHLEPVPITEAGLAKWWQTSKVPRCVKTTAEVMLRRGRDWGPVR